MLTRKNIYHYIAYVIFALVLFCSIGLHSVSLSDSSADISAVIPLIIRYAIIFVAAALIVLSFKAIYPRIPDKYLLPSPPVIPKRYEIFGLVFINILMFFARVMYITSKIGTQADDVFFNYAIGASDILPDTTFASFIYANIGRILCKISPTVFPLYAFNTLLQIGIICFTYFMFKRSLRIRYGILAALLVAFTPFGITSVTVFSPGILLAFLYVGYFYYLGIVYNLNRKSEIIESYDILYIVALGAFSGFVAMWDILGVSLPFLTIATLLFMKKRENVTIFQNRFFQALIYLASFGVSLFAFLCLTYNNGLRSINHVINYINSFYPRGLSLSIVPPMEHRIEGIAIFVFALIAILSFIRNEWDKGIVSVIIIDFAALFTFVKFNTTDYSFILNYAFMFLATVGFYESYNFTLSTEEVTEDDEKRASANIPRKKDDKKNEEEQGNRNRGIFTNVSSKPSASMDALSKTSKRGGLISLETIYVPNKPEDKKPETEENVSGIPGRNRPSIRIGYGVNESTIRERNEAEEKALSLVAENETSNVVTDVSSVAAEVENTAPAFSENVPVNDDINANESSDNVQVNAEGINAIESSENKTDVFDNQGTDNIENADNISTDNRDSGSAESFAKEIPGFGTPGYSLSSSSDDISKEVTDGLNSDVVAAVIMEAGTDISSKDEEDDKYKTEELYVEDKRNKEKDDTPVQKRTFEKLKDEVKEGTTNMKTESEGFSLLEADPNYRATSMIKNPLPIPKPHVARELTYDYDFKDEELDFDITDLKGKDYYDI